MEIAQPEVERTSEMSHVRCCTSNKRAWKVEHAKRKPFSELPVVNFYSYLNKAHTGDIVLFNTHGPGPSFIRLGTNSLYDHVGIIVKLKGQSACVLEALSKGVRIDDFTLFHSYDWYKNYRCIAVRRLHSKLTKSQVRCLEEFVQMVIGRKYGLWNLSKMRRWFNVNLSSWLNDKIHYDAS